MRNVILILFGVLMLLASPYANAGFFDKWSDLEGYVLLASGQVKALQCPYEYDFDRPDACLNWPNNLYIFDEYSADEICFKSTTYYSFDEVLIFANKSDVKAVKLDTIGTGIDIEEISPLKCPSKY